MEHLDEHEMLILYSEMTAFDFNSEEFRNVRKDYLECKNLISSFVSIFTKLMSKFSLIQNY